MSIVTGLTSPSTQSRAKSEILQIVRDGDMPGSVIHFDNQDIDDAIDNDVLDLYPNWKDMEWVNISDLVCEPKV